MRPATSRNKYRQNTNLHTRKYPAAYILRSMPSGFIIIILCFSHFQSFFEGGWRDCGDPGSAAEKVYSQTSSVSATLTEAAGEKLTRLVPKAGLPAQPQLFLCNKKSKWLCHNLFALMFIEHLQRPVWKGLDMAPGRQASSQ